jgi:hypothetical protein
MILSARGRTQQGQSMFLGPGRVFCPLMWAVLNSRNQSRLNFRARSLVVCLKSQQSRLELWRAAGLMRSTCIIRRYLRAETASAT